MSIKTNAYLALQLGVEPDSNYVRHYNGKNPVNLHLGLPFQLFVYSDTVQTQIVVISVKNHFTGSY